MYIMYIFTTVHIIKKKKKKSLLLLPGLYIVQQEMQEIKQSSQMWRKSLKNKKYSVWNLIAFNGSHKALHVLTFYLAVYAYK